MTFIIVFCGIIFFIALLVGGVFGTIGSFIKMFEFFSEGRFKIFGRSDGEPIFSRTPRPIED